MTAKIDTLAIACMDYRLNDTINGALRSGKVVALRNAGGDAESLTRNIEDVLDATPSIDKIIFYLHDNGCGGMKVAWGVNNVHDPALAAYGSRFRMLGPTVKDSNSLKELEEKKNPGFQVRMLKERFANGFNGRKISVEAELVHVADKNHAEHCLLVTKDMVTSYERLRVDYRDFDPEHAYIIQYSNDIKEVLPDISIAVKVLGLSNIKTIAVPPKSDLIDIQGIAGPKANVSSLAQTRNRCVN